MSPTRGDDSASDRAKQRGPKQRPRATGTSQRTPGGWIPVGTAAGRRANHALNSTPRGQRTRRTIIDSARRVFERDGYMDANIEQIVAEARVARGSFYTYFPSKLDVFNVVVDEVGQRILEAVSTRAGDERLDPIRGLERSNRRFIQAYRDNAAIYGLVEQLATINPITHQMRKAGRQSHVDRVAERIRRWQAQGLADPGVDPATTAAALVSMISNFCYWWLVGGDKHDERMAATTLTDIWARAVGLRTRPSRSWLEKVSNPARGGLSHRTTPTRN